MNFTSKLMQKIYEWSEIKHSLAVAHHTSTNVLVERYVQTLGKMLKAPSAELPRSWDVALTYLILGSRDSPSASLGWYFPNELILGRWITGKLYLLKTSWEGKKSADFPPSVTEYLDRLKQAMEQVRKATSDFFQKG